ncbi:MAG: Ig-like domain-containing protein [Caldilineaceae bacterium]
MQLMSSRLSWGTKEQPSPFARPFGIVLTFLALGLGLLAATGPYKNASAHSIFSDYKPVGPAQPVACVAQGIQNPVDADGGAVTINMLEGNTPVSERTPIHQVTITAGGAQVNNFCLDLSKQILAESYCQQGSATSPELIYLLTTYPPSLTDRIAQAARQAAVWHFTNGVNLQNPDATDEGPTTDAQVLAAYNAILADIETNINPNDPPAQYLVGPPQLTVTPANASISLDVSTAHTVTVNLSNGGKPLVGYTVSVTTSLGTVNKASAVTNAQGQADFVVTNAISGTSAIVASAQVILPVIRVFQSEAAPEGNQPIGGPGQSIYDPSFQAAATWVSPSGLEEVDEPRTAWLLFLPALEH